MRECGATLRRLAAGSPARQAAEAECDRQRALIAQHKRTTTTIRDRANKIGKVLLRRNRLVAQALQARQRCAVPRLTDCKGGPQLFVAMLSPRLSDPLTPRAHKMC